jgi:hypothetical protein
MMVVMMMMTMMIKYVRVSSRWEDNIKMDLREVGWSMDWIRLAQVTDRWQAVVNVVLKLRCPSNSENFLTS